MARAEDKRKVMLPIPYPEYIPSNEWREKVESNGVKLKDVYPAGMAATTIFEYLGYGGGEGRKPVLILYPNECEDCGSDSEVELEFCVINALYHYCVDKGYIKDAGAGKAAIAELVSRLLPWTGTVVFNQVLGPDGDALLQKCIQSLAEETR